MVREQAQLDLARLHVRRPARALWAVPADCPVRLIGGWSRVLSWFSHTRTLLRCCNISRLSLFDQLTH